MDGTRYYYTKWSKPEREWQTLYNITYIWNLKKMIQMNLYTEQKYTHRHRKQTFGYQQGKGEG